MPRLDVPNLVKIHEQTLRKKTAPWAGAGSHGCLETVGIEQNLEIWAWPVETEMRKRQCSAHGGGGRVSGSLVCGGWGGLPGI